MPHERSYLMTKITQATPEGECPTWMNFLNEITLGDAELQDYLQRVAGYALTGSVEEHALFFFYGKGGNGKSVLINTLGRIVGDYQVVAPSTTFTEKKVEGHPTDLASLHGARLVVVNETSEGKYWDEVRIKSVTGGDSITARHIAKDFFSFRSSWKLFISGNNKPSIRNVDAAMMRRIHMICFEFSVDPQNIDKRLEEKLWAERNGILAWALKGCLEWQRLGGLFPPQKVIEDTKEYFREEDVILNWLEERCVLDPGAKAEVGKLFCDWESWARKNGEFPGSKKLFSQKLSARNFAKSRSGEAGARHFIGIKLKK